MISHWALLTILMLYQAESKCFQKGEGRCFRKAETKCLSQDSACFRKAEKKCFKIAEKQCVQKAASKCFTEGEPECVMKYGCAGGNGGSYFNDAIHYYRRCDKVTKVSIRYGTFVNCIGFTWASGGNRVVGTCHGNKNGEAVVLVLPEDENVIGFRGRHEWPLWLHQITIVTNKQEYGPYGGNKGRHFDLVPGYPVVFLSGRSGLSVDQICAHYQAC